jgi:hypothetical protein
MKNRIICKGYFSQNLLFIALLVCLIVNYSCSKKDTHNTVKYVKTQLTANKAKTWRLKAVIVNGQSQTLTAAQSAYTKTYNSDETWIDSDGYKGTFSILTVKSLKVVTSNAIAGTSTIQYDILTINGTILVVEYTYNQVKYKFEFTS